MPPVQRKEAKVRPSSSPRTPNTEESTVSNTTPEVKPIVAVVDPKTMDVKADTVPDGDSTVVKAAVDWSSIFETATLETNKARPARTKVDVPPQVLEAVKNAHTLKRRISLPITPGDDAGIKMLADTFYAAGDLLDPPVSVQVQTVDDDGKKVKNEDATFIKVFVGTRRGRKLAPEVIPLSQAGTVISELAENGTADDDDEASGDEASGDEKSPNGEADKA